MTLVSLHDNLSRLTAILVSRFLLDLQAANQSSLNLARDDGLCDSDNSDEVRSVGSVIFAGFNVGSLGSSLSRGELGSFGDLEMDDDRTEGNVRDGD